MSAHPLSQRVRDLSECFRSSTPARDDLIEAADALDAAAAANAEHEALRSAVRLLTERTRREELCAYLVTDQDIELGLPDAERKAWKSAARAALAPKETR